MHAVFLALGSNLGNRLANLRAALEGLPPDVQVVSRSHVYETPAWGYEEQPAFLNMVIKGETQLRPTDLLHRVKQLETALGRTASFHWGPRLIDIDILFYDQLILESPDLTIPHARLHERGFVLVPLNDLAPELEHPILHKTVRQMLKKADVAGIERFGQEA